MTLRKLLTFLTLAAFLLFTFAAGLPHTHEGSMQAPHACVICRAQSAHAAPAPSAAVLFCALLLLSVLSLLDLRPALSRPAPFRFGRAPPASE